jgi:hypothetical protein
MPNCPLLASQVWEVRKLTPYLPMAGRASLPISYKMKNKIRIIANVQNQVVPLNALSENISHLEGGADKESPSKTTLTNCLLAMRFTSIDAAKLISL